MLGLDGYATILNHQLAYLLKCLVKSAMPVLTEEVQQTSAYVVVGIVNIPHMVVVTHVKAERRMLVNP